MEWNDYKQLCDSPQTFSRWMLEQMHRIAWRPMTRLRDAACCDSLRAAPLEKPSDHRGDARTDMFDVVLAPDDARAIYGVVASAVRDGRTTSATKSRGLGGFREAWREYVALRRAESRFSAEGEGPNG